MRKKPSSYFSYVKPPHSPNNKLNRTGGGPGGTYGEYIIYQFIEADSVLISGIGSRYLFLRTSNRIIDITIFPCCLAGCSYKNCLITIIPPLQTTILAPGFCFRVILRWTWGLSIKMHLFIIEITLFIPYLFGIIGVRYV